MPGVILGCGEATLFPCNMLGPFLHKITAGFQVCECAPWLLMPGIDVVKPQRVIFAM